MKTPPPELLEQIRANPAASEPRNAYADWLEKQGASPRSELIHSQLALLSPGVSPQRRVLLKQRVEARLKEHAKTWAEQLLGPGAEALLYKRGFIEEVALPEKRFAEHGEELLAREPVFKLTINVQDGKGLESAAAQPWFEQVRWLKLTGKVNAGAKALAASEHVGKLDSLLIPGVGKAGLAAVLNSEKLTGLRTLSLSGGVEQLDDEDLQVFTKGKLRLERLLLTGCLQLSDGIGPLAEAEWLRPLKWLALNRNELTDEDVEVLAKSPVFENLERLELAHNELSPEGVAVLSSAKVLPRLKHLDLSEMWWDGSGLGPLQRRFRTGLKV
jgi:uncharacterized protein (TIGR02996 family)